MGNRIDANHDGVIDQSELAMAQGMVPLRHGVISNTVRLPGNYPALQQTNFDFSRQGGDHLAEQSVPLVAKQNTPRHEAQVSPEFATQSSVGTQDTGGSS